MLMKLTMSFIFYPFPSQVLAMGTILQFYGLIDKDITKCVGKIYLSSKKIAILIYNTNWYDRLNVTFNKLLKVPSIQIFFNVKFALISSFCSCGLKVYLQQSTLSGLYFLLYRIWYQIVSLLITLKLGWLKNKYINKGIYLRILFKHSVFLKYNTGISSSWNKILGIFSPNGP